MTGRLLTATEVQLMWDSSPDNRDSLWANDAKSNSLRLSDHDAVMLKAQRDLTLKEVAEWLEQNKQYMVIGDYLTILMQALERGELPK